MTVATVDAPSGPLRFVRFASPPNRLGHCGPVASDGVGEYLHAPIDGGVRRAGSAVRGRVSVSPIARRCSAPRRSARRRRRRGVLDRQRPARPGEPARLRQLDRRPFPAPGRLGMVADRRIGSRGCRPSQLSRAPRDPVDRADAARRRRRAAAHRRPVLCQLGPGGRHRPTACRSSGGVRSQWAGSRLRFGEPVLEQVSSPIDVQVGDWVALHWGTVCERLRPDQLGWLRRTTLDQLATFAAG